MTLVGNFELALIRLLRNIEEGVKSKDEILEQWDTDRGDDWYTSTKRINELRIEKFNRLFPHKGAVLNG